MALPDKNSSLSLLLSSSSLLLILLSCASSSSFSSLLRKVLAGDGTLPIVAAPKLCWCPLMLLLFSPADCTGMAMLATLTLKVNINDLMMLTESVDTNDSADKGSYGDGDDIGDSSDDIGDVGREGLG